MVNAVIEIHLACWPIDLGTFETAGSPRFPLFLSLSRIAAEGERAGYLRRRIINDRALSRCPRLRFPKVLS